MVVYAEYLFLENFITGIILLFFTARLTGYAAQIRKLVLGSVLCGISSFSLFVPAGTAAALIFRSIAAAVICLTVFGLQNLLKRTVIFLFLSFLSGGAAMAFFLWQQIPALSGNGVLYLDSMTYCLLAGCGIPAMVLTFWFIELIKKQRKMELHLGEVELELEGHICRMRACVDSGNSLCDPLSGNSVILVDEKGGRMLPFHEGDYPERFAVIPYQAVGVESGLLTGMRLDRIRYREKEMKNVILAWYSGTFDGYEVLLNREILEGGL